MTREEALDIIRFVFLHTDNHLNDDRQISAEDIHEALVMACVALCKNSLPLPSNLDEAAFSYENNIWESGFKECGYSPQEVSDAFKAGAEWMAGQGVKIGETKIYLEDDGDEPPYAQEWLDLESTEFKIPDGAFKDGDEVEVFLRKK